MINLNDVLQSAHGGQAIDTLSTRFGLSPAQTQSAIDAVLPALRMGLQNKAEGGGLGSILGQMAGGTGSVAYQDPAATQSPAVTQQGHSILGSLFGGGQQTADVAQQAAKESGIPASVIQSMLPVIASMVIGGLTHGAQNGAFGGMLSSVLGSFMGGGGATTGTMTGPSSSQTGGIGGVLGSVLGGLFGGDQQAADGPAMTEAEPTRQSSGAPDTPAGTLSELSNMFTAGTSASPQHEAALANILGR